MNRRVVLIVSLAATVPLSAQPQLSVLDSPHNLSSGGPGGIRALSEPEVCIFCHTPHRATPVRPLWNRLSPTGAYTVYSSRALDAQPGQPTGESKMCLSCHDGTIALGSVVSRATPILFAGGVTTLPPGASNVGTDLSDDHPLSFPYDTALVAQDPNLRDPSTLPPEIKLDANQELQCTSCHDAHNNALGNFLVLDNQSSAMCMSCHQIDNTSIVGHSDCASCHQPHTSPSGPYLLKAQTIGETCLACHDGSFPGAPNVGPDFNKPFVHETGSPVDPPAPAAEHTSCTDCHNPHTMDAGGGQAPAVHPNFGQVTGVSASGSSIAVASYEYEVCFKCHADTNTRQPWVPRQIVQNNARLEFDLASPSYHPVEGPGQNPDVPSLVSGLTTASTMYCSDCHGSDNGLTGPDGVHGSNFGPILVARYETADFTSESAAVYALCYQCHDRNSILNDDSFSKHKKHIQNVDAPCSACHDAHGISSVQGNSTNNTHLINFDTSIVFPNNFGTLEFVDTGVFRGECSLKCHNRNHNSSRYP